MSENKKAIGIFDSGLGGISVLKELRLWMPYENYIYYGDSAFAPYGEKSKEEITERCKLICDYLLAKGVKAIVIACNTATSACVNELREVYREIPIIGMEPALKVAADRKSEQNILVMATSFTLKEKKFEKLMSRYSEQNNIYKQPCPKLVQIVEKNCLVDEKMVNEQLRAYLEPYESKELDSIVLGCTHFVFFKTQMQAIAGDQITIVDGNKGTARHVKEVLRYDLQSEDNKGSCIMYNSIESNDIISLSNTLLNI